MIGFLTAGDISDLPDFSDDDFNKDMPYIPLPLAISNGFDDDNNDNNVIRVGMKHQSQ